MNDYITDAIKQVESILGSKLSGTILEVGAGNGMYSCYLAKNQEINKIYALDYSEDSIKQLMSYAIEKYPIHFNDKKKIYPVVGSFNHIKLPDNSLDFIININSLHHSEDRETTFNELYRVLKPDGYLISIDRASYNTLTNFDLNRKLDIEFSAEFKKQRGLNPAEKYTRRMNSEHDPLLSEWEYLLCKSGFKIYSFWIYKIVNPVFFAILYKIFIGSFFFLFGNMLMKKKVTQIGHLKIPYYPFFTRKNPRNLLLIAKKLPYSKMP